MGTIQINKIRDENVKKRPDTEEIERNVKTYFKHLYFTKLGNQKEWIIFLIHSTYVS